MPAYRKNVNVTELDFDEIKNNLINYFSQTDSQFRDWNFAGSGLNILIDALAYNTHYNAILAHMAVSESFIDSAQLRSSVVSLAKLIGYTPRSSISATAVINLSFTAKSTTPASITLPKGTYFSSTINDIKYTFVTDDEHILPLIDGYYKKDDIILKQANPRISTYNVNYSNTKKNPTYIINDQQIDLGSLIVRVYSSASNTTKEVYNVIEDNVSGINEKSAIYFISENSDENYQITFGDGVFGKKLPNLSQIEVSYYVTSGSEANACSVFTFADAFPTGTKSALITTQSPASGGSNKENIESIRYNAPLSFITQNRAITADDYKTLLREKFGYKTISVWGGEDHIPVSYGQVFISIKPNSLDVLTLDNIERENVLDFIKQKKAISIIPRLVDPEYIDLTLDVYFKYNKNAIELSRGQIEADIRNIIQEYNTTVLETFDGVFRYSNVLKLVDTYHPAILNSHLRIFVSRTITIVPTLSTTNFGTSLTIDDDKAIISSSAFTMNGVICYFGDESFGSNTNLRRIYIYTNKKSQKVKILNDVGVLNLIDGEMTLYGISSEIDVPVTLDMLPLSNDIASKRNQLLKIDMNRLLVKGEIDSITIGGSSRSIDYKGFQRDR